MNTPPLPEMFRTASGRDNPPFQGSLPPKQRNHACVVEIHGNGDNDLTGSLGSPTSSALIFRASTVTILPTFEIIVRGLKGVEVQSSETLLFDLDQLQSAQFARARVNSHAPDVQRLRATGFLADDATGFLYSIHIEYRHDLHPILFHSHRRGLISSEGYGFVNRARSSGIFTIYLNATIEDDLKRLGYWQYVANVARRLCVSSLPEDANGRNDWWFTREEDYLGQHETGKFQRFVDGVVAAPYFPPWLEMLEQNQEPKYAFFYPAAEFTKVRIPSPKAFDTIYGSALLWSRRYELELYDRVLPPNARFTVSVTNKSSVGSPATFHIAIRLPLKHHGDALPKDGTMIKMDFPETQRLNSVLFKGAVSRETPHMLQGYDLLVIARPSNRTIEDEDSRKAFDHFADKTMMAPQELTARITVNKSDPDTLKQFEVMKSCLTKPQSALHGYLFGWDGRDSPSLVVKFLMNPKFTKAERLQRMEEVENVIPNGLNQDQLAAYNGLLRGIKGGMALVEGLPGTGKTTTIVRFVIAATRLGFKVLYAAEARAAIKAAITIFLRECATLAMPKLPETLIRLYPAAFDLELALASFDNDDDDQSDLGRGSMSPAVHNALDRHDAAYERRTAFASLPMRRLQYMYSLRNAPQADEAVEELRIYYKAMREGRMPQRDEVDMSYGQALLEVNRSVLRRHNICMATLSGAYNLSAKGFKADVVIVDEASQANVPRAMMAFVGQDDVLLNILAFDNHQLQPQDASAYSQMNPSGNWLRLSVSQYMSLSNARMPVLSLTRNFRSHSAIINLVSRLIYHGRLIQDESSTMNDPQHTVPVRVTTALNMSMTYQRVAYEPIVFLDVTSYPAKEENGTSIYNAGGVNTIVDLCQQLLNGGVRPRAISIITMYSADKKAINYQSVSLMVDGEQVRLEVNTVDAFQGRQNEVVVLHFVSASNPKSPFGFARDPRRLCVALSRAMRRLYIVGNLTYWRQNRGLWQRGERFMDQLITYVDANVPVVRIPNPNTTLVRTP